MRTLLAVSLLALLLAAGCSAPAQTTTSTTPPPPHAASLLDAAVQHVPGIDGLVADAVTVPAMFLTGHDSGEPTIGVSKEGRIFVTSATFNTAAATNPTGAPRTDIFRSDDGGATWKEITPTFQGQKQQPVTGDPMLFLDVENGRLWDIDQIDIACDYVSHSDDNGDTWSPPSPACLYPPSDHQTIVAANPTLTPASPLYPKLVFVCMNQIALTNCARSLDGGTTFQQATPPFRGISTPAEGGSTDICSGLVGHLKAAPDGTLYLPREECGAPIVAVSSDSALTWTVTRVSSDSTATDPAITVTADGTVYYAYVDGDGLLKLSSSSDKGATWTNPVPLLAPGLTASNLPAIAAGADGTVAVAFYATQAPGGYAAINKAGAKNDNVTWDGYIAVVRNATSQAPTITTARVNPADDPLVRGTCGPGRCRAVYDFIDVQVDADGRPWAAFVDTCAGDCLLDGAKATTSTARNGAVGTLASGADLLTGAPLVPIHGAK